MLLSTLSNSDIELLVGLAVCYTVGLFALQRKLSNPKKMREMNRKLKQYLESHKELLKNNASQEDIQKKMNEINALAAESMKGMMVPLVVSLPVLGIIYLWLLPYLAATYSFTTSTIMLLGFSLSYRNFFILSAFVPGIILTIVVMAYDKAQAKKELVAEEQKIEGDIPKS